MCACQSVDDLSFAPRSSSNHYVDESPQRQVPPRVLEGPFNWRPEGQDQSSHMTNVSEDTTMAWHPHLVQG